MVLILIASTRRQNRVIRAVIEHFESQREQFLLASVADISLSYDNMGRTRIHHPVHGEISPDVVFYWLSQMPSLLEAMELGGYRLINPIRAWRIGRDKALQLALFEKNHIAHPWTLFTYAGWRAVESRLNWDEQEYVFKPHNSGRGQGVHKAASRSEARVLLSHIPRYRMGLLVQEYVNHAPKPRHHYRVNVVGGEPVSGMRLEVQGSDWVTNQARGGQGVPSEQPSNFPQEAVELAVRAATAVGSDYSGVDVIEGPDGAFYVLEANELPAFGETTALYLARHILKVARAISMTGG